MIPRSMFLDNLWLAERVRNIPGCVVECGVWRGGMSAGFCRVLGPERNYHLFDSFLGLPEAREIDGASAIEWQKNVQSPQYYDNCRAPVEFAREAMNRSGASAFQLIAGWFEDTVPKHRLNEPIALLHLDADWYDSTKVCLDTFFDQVATGGIIIIDDYHTWTGCSRAVHDFLSHRSAFEKIEVFNENCYIIKLSPDQRAGREGSDGCSNSKPASHD